MSKGLSGRGTVTPGSVLTETVPDVPQTPEAAPGTAHADTHLSPFREALATTLSSHILPGLGDPFFFLPTF